MTQLVSFFFLQQRKGGPTRLTLPSKSTVSRFISLCRGGVEWSEMGGAGRRDDQEGRGGMTMGQGARPALPRGKWRKGKEMKSKQS